MTSDSHAPRTRSDPAHGGDVASDDVQIANHGRPNDSRRSPRKVLVVDDAKDIVAIISRMLAKEGYDVLTAHDGQSGLEIARQERPDLLLLDWMLPGIDGLDVCRALKSDDRTRDIMVILVTGRGTVMNLVEGFDAGADDFVPKPFKHPELLARVRSALRLKKLTDELSERNRQLVDSQNELVRSEKMATIGLLASGIAHEFNNIMAGISGFAQLAKRDDKFAGQLIEVALTQTARALELTKSLSAYHRRTNAEATICDVGEVIEGSVCLVRKEIESNGVRLDVQLDDVGHASISPGHLQDIVLNLLLNAIHAIRGRGSIRLSVTPDEASDSIVIRVADTGEGIAPEHLDRIFDPFFTTKGALGGGRSQGTGLGLSVCYNVVQAHRGTIDVESELGAGTTFRVTLRTADAPCDVPERTTQDAVAAACAPEENPLRILVVDDEGQIRSMLQGFLEGHAVTCCASGDEALAIWEPGTFDFMVLDICMHDSRNGIETLEALVQADPEAKVILASGRLPDDIPQSALDLAHGHLLKPFQLEDLNALLRVSPSTVAAGAEAR